MKPQTLIIQTGNIYHDEVCSLHLISWCFSHREDDKIEMRDHSACLSSGQAQPESSYIPLKLDTVFE